MLRKREKSVKLIFFFLSFPAAISPIPKHRIREFLLLLNFRWWSEFYYMGTLPQNQCLFQHDLKQPPSPAEHWTVVTVCRTVWAAHPLLLAHGWPWALRSVQVPPAGACTIRLESEAGRKTSPATPYKDLSGCWTLEESLWGSSEEHKTAFTTHLFWDGWTMILHVYPFLALQDESKAKLEDTVTGGDGWGCGGRFRCCVLVLGLEHSLLNLIQWSKGGVVNLSLQKSFGSTGLSSPKCFSLGCWSKLQSWSVSHLWGIIPRNPCQWSREGDGLLRRLCNCTHWIVTQQLYH